MQFHEIGRIGARDKADEFLNVSVRVEEGIIPNEESDPRANEEFEQWCTKSFLSEAWSAVRNDGPLEVMLRSRLGRQFFELRAAFPAPGEAIVTVRAKLSKDL